MPYDNKLNRQIAEEMRKIYLRNIQHTGNSYDLADSNLGYANKMKIDDNNIDEVRNELEDMEDNLPSNNELSGDGPLNSNGAFARGTFRDTGFERVEGAGFFNDLWSGVKSVVKPASQILSMIPHPYAQTASTGLNMASNILGDGKKPRKPRTGKKTKEVNEEKELLLKRTLEGGKPNKSDVGLLVKESAVVKAKRGRPNKMKGGTDLGEPHNMIKPNGTTGDGKPKRKIGEGKQKIVPVAQMQSSGMSGQGKIEKRADIVKKIMKERGVSMIKASSIVKSEGLYKAKKSNV